MIVPLRRRRGSALVLSLFFAVVLAVAGITLATSSFASSQQVRGESDVDQAALAAETGLFFIAEQWRKSPSFLTVTTPGTSGDDWTGSSEPGWATMDGVALKGTKCASLGTWYPVGAPLRADGTPSVGGFALVGVLDVQLAANTTGKKVRVVGMYRNAVATWEGLLSPNLSSPIQGVGTINNQTWSGGSSFTGEGGSIFGNGNIALSGAGTVVNGDASVKSGKTVTVTAPASVTGAISQSAPAITFPPQDTIVQNAENAAAGNKNTAGYWKNAKTEMRTAVMAASDKPSILEVKAVGSDITSLGSNWGGTNGQIAGASYHVYMKGGNVTLSPGNYSFGRLIVDGGTLTIPAPPAGSTLVLPDIQVTNGGLLILDATNGGTNPAGGATTFSVVSGANNAYQSLPSTGSVEKYNLATNAYGAATTTTTKTGGETGIWTGNGGVVGGPTKPKVGTADTNGYDDWQVMKDSALAVVTTGPNNKGAEFFNSSGSDLVLTNGGRVLAGIQATDLAALKSAPHTAAGIQALDGLAQNAAGFIAWSAQGSLTRFDINAGAGASSNPSKFTGLTYGAFQGSFGPTSEFKGAFVGDFVNANGADVEYDPRLRDLLVAPVANTEHVVTKRRIRNPPLAVLATTNTTAGLGLQKRRALVTTNGL